MLRNTIAILTLFLLSSCANYKLNIAKDLTVNAVQNQAAMTGEIVHTMYLIGDAGNAKKDKNTPIALALLKEKLDAASENSSVIFLGDNIYPDGMAPKQEKEERAQDEFRLDAQLNALANFKGRPFFDAFFLYLG